MTTGQIISFAILAVLAFLALRIIRSLLRPRPVKRRSGTARSKANRKTRRKSPAKIAGKTRTGSRPLAVVDGSNVMHWQDSTPQLEPVIKVVRLLERQGYRAGVIFDANAGYRLRNRYMDDDVLGRQLGLPEDRVLVVPRGQQADPFLLTYARDSGAIVVSNDRFRDRLAEYPELAAPGRLVRGGWRDGKPWLDLP